MTVPQHSIEIPPQLLRSICGSHDENLSFMAQLFGSSVESHGNFVFINSSDAIRQELFQDFLHSLQDYAGRQIPLENDLLEALFQASKDKFQGRYYDLRERSISFPRGKHTIFPKNLAQYQLLEMFCSKDVVFSLGPAGTGKTFLAIAYGLKALLDGEKEFLILTRPVVEAGESLGYLPGDFTQKLSPYMLPLFDSIRYLIKGELIQQLEERGAIEIAPLAYMRGRSLRNAVLILDEAQNATFEQIKMLLTRLGQNSKAILTGDPSQSDLRGRSRSGLGPSAQLLGSVEGVGVQQFHKEDIVRSPLVKRIIQKYEEDGKS